jgi:hypothetical protein
MRQWHNLGNNPNGLDRSTAMKRDMDLIRLLLLDIEGEEEVNLSPFTEEQIEYHNWLLLDAGMARGKDISGYQNVPHHRAILIGLNWEGHDFIDAARDVTIWNKTQKTIVEKVGTAAIDVVKSLLLLYAKEQLGLA